MKIIEITRGERAVIEELENGAVVSVTHTDKGREITMEGAKKKHRADVVYGAFLAAEKGGILKETDPGLFEGCGQCFIVVR